MMSRAPTDQPTHPPPAAVEMPKFMLNMRAKVDADISAVTSDEASRLAHQQKVFEAVTAGLQESGASLPNAATYVTKAILGTSVTVGC